MNEHVDNLTGEVVVGVPQMPASVADAIAKVMAEVPKLGKGERNTHGSYNFASIDDFLEAVRPLCAKHGLVIVQDEDSYEVLRAEATNERNKPTNWLVIRFRFTLAHSGGETWAHRPARTIMVNSAMGSQAFGAGQSYALKQFMRSLFQIATGEKGEGVDVDYHDKADLASAPVARKSSAQLKRDDAWKPVLSEMNSIRDADELEAWRARVDLSGWPPKWVDALDERYSDRLTVLRDAETSPVESNVLAAG